MNSSQQFDITYHPLTSGSVSSLLAIQNDFESCQQAAGTFPSIIEKQESIMKIETEKNNSALRMLEHNIRNSLAAILGSAELLKDENLTAEQLDHINNINKAGDQLLASLNTVVIKPQVQRLNLIKPTRFLQQQI